MHDIVCVGSEFICLFSVFSLLYSCLFGSVGLEKCVIVVLRLSSSSLCMCVIGLC